MMAGSCGELLKRGDQKKSEITESEHDIGQAIRLGRFAKHGGGFLWWVIDSTGDSLDV